MNKNQKIFRYVLIIFTIIMAVLAFQMGMNTTAPWNKKKQRLERMKEDSLRKDSLAKSDMPK
ncbi:hypothetical protein SAMN04515674_10783 [Pseudarcicella hirudinis]|uniref:Uncharacterized protein n=1 Tax=Pseudarcicella hirudinis TaxID=1079859 RepID=A0A1I5UAV2_9BACT|nr:hypothetical protein [Pseudarcicella hirudinis]SFP92342.1 hypothetical protein SAMN04515674_10783 [Pseudarcicella hirudinis]